MPAGRTAIQILLSFHPTEARDRLCSIFVHVRDRLSSDVLFRFYGEILIYFLLLCFPFSDLCCRRKAPSCRFRPRRAVPPCPPPYLLTVRSLPRRSSDVYASSMHALVPYHFLSWWSFQCAFASSLLSLATRRRGRMSAFPTERISSHRCTSPRQCRTSIDGSWSACCSQVRVADHMCVFGSL